MELMSFAGSAPGRAPAAPIMWPVKGLAPPGGEGVGLSATKALASGLRERMCVLVTTELRCELGGGGRPARQKGAGLRLPGREKNSTGQDGLPLSPGRLFAWQGRFPSGFLPGQVHLVWKKGSWRSH